MSYSVKKFVEEIEDIDNETKINREIIAILDDAIKRFLLHLTDLDRALNGCTVDKDNKLMGDVLFNEIERNLIGMKNKVIGIQHFLYINKLEAGVSLQYIELRPSKYKGRALEFKLAFEDLMETNNKLMAELKKVFRVDVNAPVDLPV